MIHINQLGVKDFLLFLIFSIAFVSNCWSQFSKDIFKTQHPSPKAEIDSLMNIDNLTEKSYNSLIGKMFVLDQKYRAKLMEDQKRYDNKHVRDIDPQVLSYMRAMSVNDRANQALLLRLLKKFSWPSDVGGDGASFKAWHIVWHASRARKKSFHPYLIEAANNSLIDRKLLKQFEKSM